MMPEEDIHKLLAEFGPAILAVLESIDFFDLEGPYEPSEIYASIPRSVKTEYIRESRSKNINVYTIVGQAFALYGLYSGINQLRATHPTRIKQLESKKSIPHKSLSAKDYQNKYVKEHGGEFITKMSRTDQKKLMQFLWQNADKNERPLARNILKTQPQLAYLVDNKEWRLRTIKRTEINRAKNYGSLYYAKDCGFVAKRWNTAGDRRVRPSHRANAGITILMDDAFPNGENFPGEITINCRCNLAYDLDKTKITKNPSATYDQNLKDIEAETEKERTASKVSPSAPIDLTIEGGKSMPGEAIPIKTKLSEPNFMAFAEHQEQLAETRAIYDSLPDALKKNVKEVVLSPTAWREDAVLSKQFGRKVRTEAAYDKEHQRILGFPDKYGKVVPIEKGPMAHELAHGIDIDISNSKEWLSIVEKDGNFASQYARESFNLDKSYKEDFAEAVRRYTTDKEKFTKYMPNRAKYLEEVVFA